jgi:hypothetical protein
VPFHESRTKNPAIAGLHYSFFALYAIARRGKLLLRVEDADELSVLRTLLLELYVPVFLGKQRVIAADSDIRAGVETCATLTNDNIARNDFLAAIDFNA